MYVLHPVFGSFPTPLSYIFQGQRHWFKISRHNNTTVWVVLSRSMISRDNGIWYNFIVMGNTCIWKERIYDSMCIDRCLSSYVYMYSVRRVWWGYCTILVRCESNYWINLLINWEIKLWSTIYTVIFHDNVLVMNTVVNHSGFIKWVGTLIIRKTVVKDTCSCSYWYSRSSLMMGFLK